MRRDWLPAALLLLPALVLLVSFTHSPAIQTVIDSFWSTPRGRRPSVFVGFANYERLMADPTFRRVMWNNTVYAALTIPASIVLALGDGALCAGADCRARLFAAGLFHADGAAADCSGQYLGVLFSTRFGMFEQLRGWMGLSPRNWLGDQTTALYGITIVTIWAQAGFFMIFYLAALQTIPPALREAAAIEGCPRLTFFRRVTWPLLMPTTLFLSVNATINAFRTVDHLFVMTQGGPNHASNLLLYYIYETGFSFWDTAYAATLTVVMVVILVIVGLGQFFLMDRRVHYK
jgi:sn-glycerol 3-phosphate transport system permease protein